MIDERTRLTDEDRREWGADLKLGFLATLDPAGLPHVTLITSMQAKGDGELTWGQFCEGEGKDNCRRDGRCAFAIVTLARRTWTGRAVRTGERTTGEDHDAYNRKPLFRYNSYFGIHTVHFMDLVAVRGPWTLSTPVLAAGGLLVTAGGTALGLAAGRGAPAAMNGWTRGLLDRLDTLKVAAWVRPDGHPEILPGVAASTAGTARVVIASIDEGDRLRAIPRGAPVAVFAINMATESVLVRGRIVGAAGAGSVAACVLDVERVYNSMPPKHGQVWPRPPLGAVREF